MLDRERNSTRVTIVEPVSKGKMSAIEVGKEDLELLPNGGVGESVLKLAASFAKQKREIGSVDESKGGAQDFL